MTLEQSTEDAFSAVSRLEWLLLHAKAADFARIDMEREVPQCAEQIRRVLRVYSESARMTGELLVAAERERCAKIAESFKTGYVGEYHVKAVERDARAQIAARIMAGK